MGRGLAEVEPSMVNLSGPPANFSKCYENSVPNPGVLAIPLQQQYQDRECYSSYRKIKDPDVAACRSRSKDSHAAGSSRILFFSLGDPLKLDKNSSTARVVGVCARSCMQNTTRVHGNSSFAVECAKISIWLSFVISYGCTGRGWVSVSTLEIQT